MTKRQADRQWRYRVSLRHALVAALGTSAGAAAVFGGVITLLAGHSIRPQADNCGLIACTASVPTSPGALPRPKPRATRSHLQVLPAKRRVPPSPSPSGSPTSPHPTPTTAPAPPHPSPSPSPPKVTVGYSLIQQWDGGFEGKFTIVNHGSTSLSGWVLAVTFSRDHIDSVWDASSKTAGHRLTLTPASYQPSIPPGGSQSAFFTANGMQLTPTGCAFNGKACG